MNETVKRFFSDHQIPVDKLSGEPESYIWRVEEIDKIVANYGFDEKKETDYMSIADIKGYDICGGNAKNVFASFNELFDELGDTYHSRSCGLLNIPQKEIIDTLSSSFTREPIVVRQIHENDNVIYNNGLHRYTVLRAHFLSESNGLDKNSEEYKAVKQKYTIPVAKVKVDLIKTYSNYLLSSLPNLRVSISNEYDENYYLTENVIVHLADGQQQVMNNSQLIEFTRMAVLSAMNDMQYKNMIEESQTLYPFFQQYIQTYLPELSYSLDKSETGEKQI